MPGSPLYPIHPSRLIEIDDLLKFEYFYLTGSDKCYCLWERPAGTTWQASSTVQLITNLKISPSALRLSPLRGRHKISAINHCAKALGCLPAEWLSYTFVPIPPSVVKDDPNYDDRLLSILKKAGLKDVRELVIRSRSGQAGAKGIRPEERILDLCIDTSLVLPKPEGIVIFDDVIAGGSHFAATKMMLETEFDDVPILGVFLARSIRGSSQD
jgi:hypothetical protein